jgi:hypothetical protein
MASKPLATKLREKRNRPPADQPWVWFTRELLESDAWRTAPINTRRFVERLMLEHMNHGGTENGNLIATFEDCAKWGIRRESIPLAQDDAVKRGLVYLTERGISAPGAGRKPSRFGLGWLPGRDGTPAPNRWKRYLTSPVPQTVAPQDLKSSTGTGTGNGQERNSDFRPP